MTLKKPASHSLCDCVEQSLERYLKDLNGEEVSGIYQMVLAEMEKPLLKVVYHHTDRNQSKTARLLGINRTTLRKKLEQHNLL